MNKFYSEDNIFEAQAQKALDMDEKQRPQNGFKQILWKMGFTVDVDVEMKKMWAYMIKNPVYFLILKGIPKSGEEPCNLTEITQNLVKQDYDKSNLNKQLKTLIDYKFVQSTEIKGIKYYKQTSAGEYYLRHAGPLMYPRDEYLTQIEKLEVENQKLRNQVKKLGGEPVC